MKKIIKNPVVLIVSAIVLFYGGLMMIVTFVFMSAISSDQLQQANQQQSNPCSSNSSTTAGPPEKLTGNGNNIQQAWAFFSHYYSSSGVAGIMGNLMVESAGTFDPNIHQFGMATGTGGYGIAQWTFDGRWQDLIRYANSEGLSPTSLEAQLNFVQNELRSGNWGNYGAAFNAMSVQAATEYVEMHYEVAGSPHMNVRISYAQQFFNQFAGGPTTDVTPSSSNSTNQQQIILIPVRLQVYLKMLLLLSKLLNHLSVKSIMFMVRVVQWLK